MPASTQFITGVRIVLLLAAEPDKLHRSGDMGRRLGINAVVIRRNLLRLCEAGIVVSKKGPGGGSKLARRLDQVTLRDVYCAVPSGAPRMPAGKTYASLKTILGGASRAFEDELARTTMAQVARKMERRSKAPAR